MKGLEILLVLLGAGAVALALGRDRPLWALATAAVVSGGAAVAAPALFVARSVIFDPVAIGLVPFLVFVPGAAAGLLTKERARRAIRSRFAHFVPADLLPQIEADPDRALTPRGAERELTVLFIDMRDFSTASEGMPPEQVVTLVNAFLSEVRDVLVTHRATIDKYMGDAIMAFWNAPIEQRDQPCRPDRGRPRGRQPLACPSSHQRPVGQPCRGSRPAGPYVADHTPRAGRARQAALAVFRPEDSR